MNIGGLTGLGSVVYALTKVGALLGAPDVLKDARRVALLLDPERLDHHGAFDVISGAAGAVLALLVLHEATGDAAALHAATKWGAHLLAACEEESETDICVWPSCSGHVEAGFAHGQAGIACALWRLGSELNDADLIEAANEAAAYERHVLGDDWAGAGVEKARAAWSRGATGIGCSRLAGYQVTESLTLRADLDAALKITRRQLSTGAASVCCGRAGRIGFLLSAASLLGRPKLRNAAKREAVRLMEQAQRNGRYRLGWSKGPYGTGLFLGAPGVAYALLRAAHPAAPSRCFRCPERLLLPSTESLHGLRGRGT